MVKQMDEARRKLLALFAPEQWEKGREYWQEGLVSETCYGDGVWQGTVTGTLGHYRVRIRHQAGRWEVECSCLERRTRCRHAAALLWGWLMEPDRFAKMEELTRDISLLSRADAAELLYRVALEEGDLLRRLLAGKSGGRAGKGISLPGLLYLVQNLGLDAGSPWFSRQVWEERWGNLLAAVEAELRQGTEEAWEALLLLTEKMLDFCSSAALPETAAGGYTACLLELLTVYMQGEVPEKIIEKLLALYLTTPLSGGEEEKFQAFFLKLTAVYGARARGTLFTLLKMKLAGEMKFLPAVRMIRLAGTVLPAQGKEWQEFAAWCLQDCRRLLPFLDFLEGKKEYQKAKELLRAAQPLFVTASGRYVFRRRLAALHRLLGENKQALYLEILSFEDRPGREEYFSLKRLAVTTGEWAGIKPRLFRSMAGKAPTLLEELDVMGERNIRGFS